MPRVVYHVHGYFPFEGTLRLERILQRWLARAALGMTCITVGPSVAANERRRFLNPSTVVGNWVDADVFHPVAAGERRALRARLALPGSAPLIVSVGACVPLKNHALIIESLPLVRRLVPDAEYVHIGSGGRRPRSGHWRSASVSAASATFWGKGTTWRTCSPPVTCSSCRRSARASRWPRWRR